MISKLLLYLGAALTALWGVAHLVPTKNVVAGFGDISEDNKNIIAMEWIMEGVALIFIGVLVSLLTFVDPENAISKLVYLAVVIALLSMAVVAFFTGFKVKFLPFRMCPVVLSSSAIFIALGGVI